AWLSFLASGSAAGFAHASPTYQRPPRRCPDMATKADAHAIAERQPLVRAAARERVQWVDAARGLAILLVVFGHAAGGLIDASGSDSALPLRYLFLGVYTFHMPVFFFLSGLFVEQRLE